MNVELAHSDAAGLGVEGEATTHWVVVYPSLLSYYLFLPIGQELAYFVLANQYSKTFDQFRSPFPPATNPDTVVDIAT